MNKILNVNLGGYALTIDDDAFEYLTAYLESIRKKFSDSEGRDEIVSDIEARLGELISQGMGGRSIVMLPDVEAAVQIMGKPEEFETEPVGTPGSGSGGSHKASGKGTSGPSVRTGRRLFRDEEDKVVGGVCSGLAAYFGIQDPVWMRLIFVVLTFLSAGFWIPAYLLMMILVRPAKTAADRLAMRGEPINVDNIAKEIEVSFERFGDKMNALGEKINGSDHKKKGFGTGHEAVSSGMTALGQIFAFMLQFIAKFGVAIAILIGLALFVGLAASWVGGIVAMVAAAPFVGFFSPFSNGTTWLGFANGFFLLGIPVIGLVLTFVRVLFKTHTPKWLGAGLVTFWVINLFSFISLAALGAKGYRQSGTVSQTIDLSNMSTDTLRISGTKMVRTDEGDAFFDGDVRLHDNNLQFDGMVDIRVRRSEDGRFLCKQIITARGASNSEAMENAANTAFNVIVDNNVLRVPLGYSIPEGTKWRVQRVRLNLEVPNGKFIVFDDDIYHRAAADVDLYDDQNDNNYISRRPNKLFRMTTDGLVCVDCDKIGDSQYSTDRNYEHFILEGNFKTEIRKYDGPGFRYSLEKANGAADVLQVIKTGDRITFTSNGKPAENLKLIIEAPVFTSLVAENTGDVTIRGFDEGRASITAKGTSHIKAYFDCNDLDVVLSGKSSLELDGRGHDLKANLVDGATLEAPNFRVSDVDISASDGSRARVYASDNAKVKTDSESKVKVDGGADVNDN